MKRTLTFITMAILPVIAGCIRLPESSTPEVLTLRATLAGSCETRTFLNKIGMLTGMEIQASFNTVFWNTNDELNVFSGKNASGRFTWSSSYGYSLGYPSVGAVFTGVLSGPVSETDSPRFWAFFPYDSDNSFDGESITFSLPKEQAAAEGTFDSGVYPHLATGNSLDDMTFHNICGGACFSVMRSNVHAVTFRSNGGEPLTGKVRCGIDQDGLPVITEVIEGIDSVMVTARPDNVLIPNSTRYYYFAVMLPQTLSQGMTITLWLSDGQALHIPIQKPVEIRRSVFGYMQDMDRFVQDDSSALVVDDIYLREAFNNAFDMNNDGVMSLSEAAGVSSKQLFNVLSNIYVSGFGPIGSVCLSFDEFQHFTGVTSIPGLGFRYWTKIKRILLPESIQTIGMNAFSYCYNLENLTIPARVETIGDYVFESCSNLAWVIMKPETPPSVGTGSFNGSFLIYVPDASVDAYKNAEGWSAYTSRIRPMSEFVE